MNKAAPGFLIPRPDPQAAVRLICFPYAGGHSAAFHSWSAHFDSDVELVLVQYPGRTTRINEPACNNIGSLTSILFQDLPNLLEGDKRPFVFFGHSFGSRVAFELAHAMLVEGYRPPSHFIASAGKAPHARPPNTETAELNDNELLNKLMKLGGQFSAALQNPEILELYLPVIRADFAANDNYFRAPTQPLHCPATILGGREDRVASLDALYPWQQHFTGEVQFLLYDGGHFFIDSHREEVLGDIQNIVNSLLYSH